MQGRSPRRDRGRQAPEGVSGHLRPVAARAPSACGRQPASRRMLLVRLAESSSLAPLYEHLLPAAGTSYKVRAGKVTGSAGLRHPSCLRSGRGEGDRFAFSVLPVSSGSRSYAVRLGGRVAVSRAAKSRGCGLGLGEALHLSSRLAMPEQRQPLKHCQEVEGSCCAATGYPRLSFAR
jgi:hypothetical protein